MIAKIFKKQIFQNTLIFSGSSILNRAIPFVLAPIITRYLAPADYGAVASFISLLGVLIVFAGVNTNGLLAVKFFNVDREYFKLLVGNIMIILICCAVVLLLFMWGFSGWLSERFALPVQWILTGLLCSICMFITNVNLALWQLEKKARSYATFTVVETLFNVGLSLFLIIVCKMTWEGRLIGIAAAMVLFGLLSLIIIQMKGYMTFRFNKLLFTEALTFGIPLIPHNLGGWLRTGVNIVIITDLIGTSDAGMYNLGSQFALVVFFIGNGFTLALSPVIYEKLANISPNQNLQLVRLNYGFFVTVLVLALSVSLVAPFVIENFFDARYQGATPYIPWLSFSFAFFSMYFAVVNYLFHYKKTIALSVISTISGILNASLCYWLVERVGAIGAAQASLVSFSFMFFVVLFYANKLHPLPWFKYRSIFNLKALPNDE